MMAYGDLHKHFAHPNPRVEPLLWCTTIKSSCSTSDTSCYGHPVWVSITSLQRSGSSVGCSRPTRASEELRCRQAMGYISLLRANFKLSCKEPPGRNAGHRGRWTKRAASFFLWVEAFRRVWVEVHTRGQQNVSTCSEKSCLATHPKSQQQPTAQ